MNSDRKAKPEQARTPVHLNGSEFKSKNSASKRFSVNLSRRPNLNETVNCKTLPRADPKIKTKLSTSYAVDYETECDIAYNDYLQALLRNQVVKKKIAEHKEVLEGQILVQNENLYKRNKNLKEIVKDTESYEEQREIVEKIDFLQENINSLRNGYTAYDMRRMLSNLEGILNSKCDAVILKHIKPLATQQDYDKFISNLRLCLSAMEKIVNSGRDFEKVHTLAEQIRNCIKVKEDVNQLQQVSSTLRKDAVYSFLKDTSDFFAIKYNNEVSN